MQEIEMLAIFINGGLNDDCDIDGCASNRLITSLINVGYLTQGLSQNPYFTYF